MMHTTPPSRIHSFDRQTFVRFALGVFIFVGFISSTFLVTQSHDTREQASVATGVVEIRPMLSNGSTTFTANQTSPLTLQLNTNGAAIVGVQLVFTVSSSVLPSFNASQIAIPVESGFVPLYSKVSPASGGYLVELALRPAGNLSSSLSFTSSTFVNIVTFNFTPSAVGNVNFSFNPALTTAIDLKNNDILKPVPSFSIPVSGSAALTPILFETTTPYPTKTQYSPTPLPTKALATPTVTPQTKPGKRKGQLPGDLPPAIAY